MKLTYRGVSYEAKPSTLEVTEGEVMGKYRGQSWHYQYPRHIPQIGGKPYLQYRGVAYSTSPLPLATSQGQHHLADKLEATACPVHLPKAKRVVHNDVSHVHLENMRRNLEYRLQVAQERGDHYLVNLLHQESQQLALQM